MRRLTSFCVLVLAACSGGALVACQETDADNDVVADDAALTPSALPGLIPIGTELVTTTNVNFRRGPGTGYSVRHVLTRGTTVTTANRTTPEGSFYAVQVGAEQGWVHGAYLMQKAAAPAKPGASSAPAASGAAAAPPAGSSTASCVERSLKFSADELPSLPAAGSAFVWGGNATDGERFLDPPYSGDFIARARGAHDRQLEVFAYLEGPCGDTDGVDDGERARCAGIHRAYNAKFAPNTSDSPAARWKPFTIRQLTDSGRIGADYCEIDNLDNAVTIPLNPLLVEIKALYDAGTVHCRLVLKNISVSALDSIRQNVAPTPAAASFIAPFHIFEDDDTHQKANLDAAMRRLKGPGAVTIISTDSNHYGSSFTNDRFLTCK